MRAEYAPLVSIIIPTYNRAAIVGRAIDSVLAQSYPQVEIIVVDDGSTDGTQAHLGVYGERVRYVWQTNAGPSAARNYGASLARGELIAFLDSDDIILPAKLEKQVHYFGAHGEVDVVLCGWRAYEPDGKTVSLETRSLSMTRLLEQILLTGTFGLIPLNAPLMRRSCFERLHGFDLSLPSREEQFLWIQALLCGCTFGMVPEVLCTIADTPESYGKNLHAVEIAMLQILERVFSHQGLPERVEALRSEIYARVYLQLGYRHLRQSRAEDDAEMGLARDDMDKALVLHPHKGDWRPDSLDLVPYQAIELAQGEAPEQELNRLMDVLFPKPLRPRWMEREFRARLHAMLAFRSYWAGLLRKVPAHALRAMRLKPAFLANWGLVVILVRALVECIEL